MKNGGYFILDFKEREFNSGMSMVIDGIYEEIESNKKALMVSGVVYNGKHYTDYYAESIVIKGSTFEINGNGITITVNDVDVVSIAPKGAGGNLYDGSGFTYETIYAREGGDVISGAFEGLMNAEYIDNANFGDHTYAHKAPIIAKYADSINGYFAILACTEDSTASYTVATIVTLTISKSDEAIYCNITPYQPEI